MDVPSVGGGRGVSVKLSDNEMFLSGNPVQFGDVIHLSSPGSGRSSGGDCTMSVSETTRVFDDVFIPVITASG